jgi:hypothetical protein
MLESLNDAYNNGKGTEQGGLVMGDNSVIRVSQGNCFRDRIYFPFRPGAKADFHTHFVKFGPTNTDYNACNNFNVYGLKHYIVHKEGIIRYVPDPLKLGEGTETVIWRW